MIGRPAECDRGPDLFRIGPWQMSYGERAVLEGVLSARKPALAIEVGTAEGGSLTRIAAHSREVHSFDLVPPSLPVAGLDHVYVHTGDSHVLLPALLAELADAGRRVDFVLIDGDHGHDGVRRDLLDLLASPAVVDAPILLHDTMNAQVRRGIMAAGAHEHPKVVHVDLDFVAGRLWCHERLRGEMWGGLGLVMVGTRALGPPGCPEVKLADDLYHPTFDLVESGRERLYGEVAASAPAAAAYALRRSRTWAAAAPIRRVASRLRSARNA